MIFCSCIVESPDVLAVPGYAILLDRGRNVFNASVPDIEAFKDKLASLKVKVLQVNRLDDFEPVVLSLPE